MILYSYVYRCCMIILETLKLSFVHDVKHCSPICFRFFVYFSDVNCWSLLGSLMLLFVCYWLSPSIFLCSCSCSQFSDSSPSLSCDQCHDLWILMGQFIVHFTLNGCNNNNNNDRLTAFDPGQPG